MEARGLSDERLADRLDVSRETVWRWRKQQHRLNPEKIAIIAKALDIEPQALWEPPGQISLDALVKDAPEELRNTAADIVRRLVRQA